VWSLKISAVKSDAEHKVCDSTKQEILTPWKGAKILAANMPVELKILFRQK
jgi:hypothetical protein